MCAIGLLANPDRELNVILITGVMQTQLPVTNLIKWRFFMSHVSNESTDIQQYVTQAGCTFQEMKAGTSPFLERATDADTFLESH